MNELVEVLVGLALLALLAPFLLQFAFMLIGVFGVLFL